jgi:hypothetical protein
MTDRTWERFAEYIGMAAPFVRRRAGEMAALAADRAQAAADTLKLPFLSAAALEALALAANLLEHVLDPHTE